MLVVKPLGLSVTLDEVIAAGLLVTIDCQETDCRAQTPVDPAFFAARRRGITTLTQLTARVNCMACGSGKIVLRLTPKPA
jgi:hypothetical protein